jgi:hypothetical protein
VRILSTLAAVTAAVLLPVLGATADHTTPADTPWAATTDTPWGAGTASDTPWAAPLDTPWSGTASDTPW